MSIQPDTWDLADGTWADFVGSWSTQYNGEASSIGGFSVFAPKWALTYSASFGLTGLAVSAFNRQLLLGATVTAVGETVLELFSATVTIRESFTAIAGIAATNFRQNTVQGVGYAIEGVAEVTPLWGVFVSAGFNIQCVGAVTPYYQRIGWGQEAGASDAWVEDVATTAAWTKDAPATAVWVEDEGVTV